jgi:hypothetical protein
MTADYIDQCCREGARVLAPGAYLLRWSDTFHLITTQGRLFAGAAEAAPSSEKHMA